MSAFFLQHKDLFEFDKYVGGGAITPSTPSFLEQYRECERRQAADAVHGAGLAHTFQLDGAFATSPIFMIPINSAPPSFDRFPSPKRTVAHAAVSHFAPPVPSDQVPVGTFYPRSPNRHPRSPDRHPRSPDRRAGADSFSVGFVGDQFHHYSRSTEALLGSPKRPQHAPEATHCAIPKLNELLIDASTRSGLVAPPKRLDDAKKIELLIGSKCVGRISAAASSSLPPAIRYRLEASSIVHQRRERLFALLRDDYMRLTS